MNASVKKYWMVHGIGCGAPRHCHSSKLKAQQEAARLAKMSPGTIFTVLVSVDAYQAPVVDVRKIPVIKGPIAAAIDPDEIPF